MSHQRSNPHTNQIDPDVGNQSPSSCNNLQAFIKERQSKASIERPDRFLPSNKDDHRKDAELDRMGNLPDDILVSYDCKS